MHVFSKPLDNSLNNKRVFHINKGDPYNVRSKARYVDNLVEDFTFQVLDGNVSFIDKDENSRFYLHGVTEDANSVMVECEPHIFKPYYYLSTPERTGVDWITIVKHKLESFQFESYGEGKERKLNWKDLYTMELVDKLPTVGFRNGLPMKFIKFKFNNIRGYKAFKKALQDIFPAPTKADILKEKFDNSINDFILCECDENFEVMKFFDELDIVSGGWVKLKAKTYFVNEKYDRAQYNWITDTLEAMPNKKTVAPVWIDSIDIEAVKADGQNAMPNPTEPDDVTASIAHTIRRSDQKKPALNIVWTWIPDENRTPGIEGPNVRIPTVDDEGTPIPDSNIIIMEYSSEAEMLNEWAKWWTSSRVSTDVVIGWNILGFDLGWIYQRLEILVGIEPESFEWGRINGVKTEKKSKSMQSRSVAFQQYTQTISPGRVFIDELVLVQRDVTLRLHSYKLERVAQHILKEGKDPVHHSQIKPLFYGNADDRGKLMHYNWKDTEIVDKILKERNDYAKFLNVSRVNRVLPNFLCPRGQQCRVYCGMRYVAHKNNYVVWRPHYHPVLDNDMFDTGDEHEMEMEDLDKMQQRWIDIMSKQKERPYFATVSNKNGQLVTVPTDELNNLSNIQIDNSMPKTIEVKSVKTVEDENTPVKRKIESVNIKGNDLKKIKTANGVSVDRVFGLLNSKNKGRRKPAFNKDVRVIRSFDNDDDQEDYSASVTDIIRSNKTKESIEKIQIDRVREVWKQDEDESKEDEDENFGSKSFTGGYVMEPIPGWYENIPVLDFNSLYPSLMITYFLDPALLVLDVDRFGPNAPGMSNIDYQVCKINDKTTFYFAKNMMGIMIQHTANLVASRKIAQNIMNSYNHRLDQERKLLQGWLGSKTDDLDKLVKEAHKFLEGKSYQERPDCLSQLTMQRLEYERVFIKKTLTDIAKDLKTASDKGTPPPPDLAFLINSPLPDDYEKLIFTAKSYINSSKPAPIKKGILEVACQIAEGHVGQLGVHAEKLFQLGCEPSFEEGCVSVIHELVTLIEKYSQESANYNAEQNELKVGGNSTYGFCGAGKMQFKKSNNPRQNGRLKRSGMMTCAPVSACVTFLGRFSIERAKQIAEAIKPGSKVIYIDTDSLFVDLGLTNDEEGFKESFVWGAKLVEAINNDKSVCGGVMKIEHEKTDRVFLIYTAKCYVQYMFTDPNKPGKIDIKGLDFKKRTACAFINNLCKRVIDILIKERDIEKAKEEVINSTVELVKTDFTKYSKDMEELVKKLKKFEAALARARAADDEIAVKDISEEVFKIKKSIKELKHKIDAQYEVLALYKKINQANYDGSVGHVKLAQRMDERNPGLGPKSGDSVKYLFYYNDARDFKAKKRMEDKIEDFDYVIDRKLKVDVLWYLENQIKKSIEKIFSVLMKNPADLLDEAIGLAQNKQMGAGRTIDEVMCL
jgi:DNA polymerase elongation subunit (family B)